MARSLLLVLAAAATHAKQLPSFAAKKLEDKGAILEQAGKWWARAGDTVYYTPPASLGLSDRVEDYYYAYGSESALSDHLKRSKVGGQGRLHIFHLPSGVSLLQTASQSSRRKSLSELKRVQSGMHLHTGFPVYRMDSTYANPLSATGKGVEETVVGKVTPELFESYLKELVAFPTRSFSNPQESAKVQEYLKAAFEGMGLKTCLQTFSRGGPATNVVARLPGAVNGDVLLGAHYDSIPASGAAPGAEDNGSGTAALLAIAKAIMEAGVKPNRSIYFVAFAGEELGLLGSQSFATAMVTRRGIPAECQAPDVGRAASFLRRREGDQHRAIIMDEIGWVTPNYQNQTVNLEAYDWAKEVMEHLAHSSRDHNGAGLEVVHSSHPFGSDHMSFLQQRIPAVLTINGDDEAYPAYHSHEDTIEKVTMSYAAKIAKMNAGALLRLSGVAAP